MERCILEVCVDSVESAIIATNAGASRLELCGNIVIGGTTPNINLFREIRKYTDIDINVLIRPRFGDFCYSNYEYNIIKEDIKMFKNEGANGVVVGLLNEEASLDLSRMEEIINIANGMTVTLHRAFDLTRDPFYSLEKSIDLGIDTILTSGQENNCLKGKELIRQLIEKSDNRMKILIGAGVTSTTIEELYAYTKNKYYHMTGKKVVDSIMKFRNKRVNMGVEDISEYEIIVTDGNEIKKVKLTLENIVKLM